jgi:endonuclease G
VPFKNKPAPRKTSRRSSRTKKSGFTPSRWALSVVTLCAAVALGSCSDSLTGTSKELARFAEAVLTSDVLREKLDALLNPGAASSPVVADQARPVARQGAEPFAACPQFFAGGHSPLLHGQPLQRPLCFDAFAVLHSGQTKTSVFVAQKLNRRLVADADEKRTDRFFADARLPQAERAELNDYRNSGYSRGHMAPAADMPTPAAMAQSFSLANMIPQAGRHNGGAWAKVEQDTRSYAARARGNVYVITGPVYVRSRKTVGENRVRVPDYVFKLVYDEASQKAWAHWHANRDDARAGRPISYQELVKRTGIEFLPGTGL